MRLYFPIDLTGNLILIEKLVLGGIWTEDLQIFNPDALTSAPLRQAIAYTIIIIIIINSFETPPYHNVVTEATCASDIHMPFQIKRFSTVFKHN